MDRFHLAKRLNMLSQPFLAGPAICEQDDFIWYIASPDNTQEFFSFRLSLLAGHHDLHRLGDCRIQRRQHLRQGHRHPFEGRVKRPDNAPGRMLKLFSIEDPG